MAEIATCGSVKPPMSLMNALGAFQPIQGPLMKLYGNRVMLVRRFLDPVQAPPVGARAVPVVLGRIAVVVPDPRVGERLVRPAG